MGELPPAWYLYGECIDVRPKSKFGAAAAAEGPDDAGLCHGMLEGDAEVFELAPAAGRSTRAGVSPHLGSYRSVAYLVGQYGSHNQKQHQQSKAQRECRERFNSGSDP